MREAHVERLIQDAERIANGPDPKPESKTPPDSVVRAMFAAAVGAALYLLFAGPCDCDECKASRGGSE